ncbi:hypothetical protein ACFXHA_43435 [Nocardia sp. NPDC059240]|uniref:hypothetical protein n=1 Tax=Nocardia sp. NPDC059240 TaxID=3346786 RepID=UPI003683595A
MTDCRSLSRTGQLGYDAMIAEKLAQLKAARVRAQGELKTTLAAGLTTAAIEDRILDLNDQIAVIAEVIGDSKPPGRQEFCH